MVAGVATTFLIHLRGHRDYDDDDKVRSRCFSSMATAKARGNTARKSQAALISLESIFFFEKLLSSLSELDLEFWAYYWSISERLGPR